MANPARQLALAALITVTSSLTQAAAQRERATHAVGKHEIVLSYGTPRWGRHNLDELEPGTTWRLGSNEATTLFTPVPLVAGSRMVAPGEYRASLYRHTNGDAFYLQVDYALLAYGPDERPQLIPSQFEEAEPARNLAIEWSARAAAASDGQGTEAPSPLHPVQLSARFGPHRLRTDLEAVPGDQVGKLRGYTLTAFRIPAELIAARDKRGKATVVASLRPRKEERNPRKPASYNLLLAGDTVTLEPALRAPTDSFGFGTIERWDDAWRAPADVEWQELESEYAHFVVTEVELKRRKLQLSCAFGHRAGLIELQIPRGR